MALQMNSSSPRRRYGQMMSQPPQDQQLQAPMQDAPAPSGNQPAPYTMPQRAYTPDIVKGQDDPSDMYEMAKQNRRYAFDQGNAIDQNLSDTIQNRSNLESGYRAKGDAAFDQLQQTPGYTDPESANILQQNGLDTPLTQEQIDAQQFTPDEQAQIKGDPGRARGYFNPGQNELLMNEQTTNAHGAIGGMESGMNGALVNMGKTTRGAIDTSQVGNMDPYNHDQSAALTYGGNATRAAVNNKALGVSDQYNRDHAWTDQDAQNMKTAAMTGVGQATQSLQDQVSRAAAASGTNSPLALSAGLNRLQREGGAQEADAALNASVAAKNIGLGVAQNHEATRLGATQTQAGMQSSAEKGLMDSALGAAGEREGLRQGAQKFITGERLSNEQDIGHTVIGNEAQVGQTRLGTEMNLGAQRQGVQNNTANTGINLEQGVDDRSSGRAGSVAANRQQTATQGQQTQFGQGTTANTNRSTRYTQVADARRQGQADYRNGMVSQGNTQAQLGSTAQGQRIQNYGTQAGAMNTATGQYGQYDINRRGQSFSGQFKQNLGSSLGSGIGKVATGGSGSGKNVGF